ncbi:hypothetical protein HME9304_02434 [Flagellimonas maritima]|uniref:histidine kinase n=1 Tax=Flagellimonas maritima TaxID=1383885 RepID=A0A2Z4LUP3_9FLAO|nr:PAS domain-containing protein [Allomuricauda aurantiaca]AWX45420.1 hypothetical protein HME9304_02434 [Allomuricauda aurantiaca]
MKTIEKIHSNYLLKQLPKATAVVDTNYILIDFSDSWLSIFGKNSRHTAKNKIFDFFDGHESQCGKPLKKCFLENGTQTIRHKMIKGQSEEWYESSLTPWFDEKENIIGTIIQTENISDIVEKEVELERITTLLKAKSEVAKVGSWEYTIGSERLSWCEVTKEIHEVAADFEPFVNEGIDFYKHGYSRNKISMLFHKALEDGTPFNERLVIITAKGNERWIAAGGKAMWKNGKIVKVFGTFQDIHDQVLAETKTKESEQLLTTLIDNLPINVFIKDKDSKKILVNKAESDYLGLSKSKLIGKTDFDLYDKKTAQISRDEDLEVMRTLKPILKKETIGIKKDGTVTNFLTSKIPLLNLQGNAYGLIGMSMDITNIKKKEDKLRDLINVTAIQNKKLVNFAHIVSHNLRSHSANFSMLLDFLNEEHNEKEKERILKMLSNASDNLLGTLEDLNEVVDINTNVNIDKKSLNLNNSIVKVQHGLSAFFKKNKVKFINKVPKDINVLCVPAYLESIILNLINNAVKYKDPNRNPNIKLSAKKQGGHIILTVTDNGLGIDLKKHGEKIFGMYKTFHNNKDAKGLGLYIIKNQIEAMNGRITVNSKLGTGSTFSVYFNEED